MALGTHVVTRIRAKKRNIYELDGQKFEAFGNDVPKPISELIRMSDINFQMQHEPHFWFNLSAGEVSRQLNKIVNLEIIDKTLANLNAAYSKARTTVEITRERMKQAKEKKKSLQWVKQLKVDFEILERCEENRRKAEKEFNLISKATGTAKRCKMRLQKNSKTVSVARKNLNRVLILRNRYLKAKDKYQALQLYVERVYDCEKRLGDSQLEFERASTDLKRLRGNRCPLCNQSITEAS